MHAHSRTALCNSGREMSRNTLFQQCGILTSVDSDEPVQPTVELSKSKWCSVNRLTVIEYSSD